MRNWRGRGTTGSPIRNDKERGRTVTLRYSHKGDGDYSMTRLEAMTSAKVASDVVSVQRSSFDEALFVDGSYRPTGRTLHVDVLEDGSFHAFVSDHVDCLPALEEVDENQTIEERIAEAVLSVKSLSVSSAANRVFWAYVQAPWQNEQSPDVLLDDPAELNEDEDGYRACEHLSGPPDYSFLLANSFETPEQAAVEAIEQWNFENATEAVHEDGAVWWVDLWTHEGEHTAVEVTTRVTFVVEPKVTPV